MLIVIVDVYTKPGTEKEFEAATVINARSSLTEEGIIRFDVIRDQADPRHFQLIEIYRSADAPAKHKETEHYKAWRAAVEPMMAKPRQSTKFEGVFPKVFPSGDAFADDSHS